MATTRSSLYNLDPIDLEDELDVELSRYYANYRTSIRDKSEIELHNYLQEKASQSKRDYTELASALLYGILMEPEQARTYFQCLSFVNRDHFATVLTKLHALATSIKFCSLQPKAREQMLWLISELTSLHVQNVDGLYLCLFRQIRGGDLSAANTSFCDQMLKLCESHRPWIDLFPRIIATATYTYLRLISEHKTLAYNSLQQREIKFVVQLMRSKWQACCIIGRDLVRILQDVSAIPELGQLWEDLIKDPQKLSPRFKGIDQLLRTPTPREFLRCRLTPNMENKLLYILQNIPAGQYQRNLNWFLQRFIATSEAEPFYVDIIRYIVAGWYPSNQILQSDVVPRYVIIGSMIRAIKNPVVAANVKLALIFDWLFFTPTDNIMFIEPSMLLMERSAERYPYITAVVVEFLKYSIEEYYPPMRDYMTKCVASGMRTMLEKGVIRGLLPLYHCPSLEAGTRENLKQIFGEFLGRDPGATVGPLPKIPATATLSIPAPATSAPIARPQDTMRNGTPSNDEGAGDIAYSKTEDESMASEPSGQHISEDDDVDRYLYGETVEETNNDAKEQSLFDDDTEMGEIKEDEEGGGGDDHDIFASSLPSPQQATTDLPLPHTSMAATVDAEELPSSHESDKSATNAANDNIKANSTCSANHESDESDDEMGGSESIQSNQSYWIFGDSLKRFKAASQSLKKAEASNDESEMELQLAIAKRSLQEVLAVFLRMAIPAETLATNLASPLRDIMVIYLYRHSHVEWDVQNITDALDPDRVAGDGTMDVFDLFMTVLWTIKDKNPPARDRLVRLLGTMTHGYKKTRRHLIGMRWWAYIARYALLDSKDSKKALKTDFEWMTGLAELNEAYMIHASSAADSDRSTKYTLLKEQLTNDIQMLGEHNIDLFHIALPLVYKYLPHLSAGNIDLLKLTVRMMLPNQLGQLVSLVQRNVLRLYGDELMTDTTFLAESLKLDAYETMYVWQLLVAELLCRQERANTFFGNQDVISWLQTHLVPAILPQLISLFCAMPPTASLLHAWFPMVSLQNADGPLQLTLMALENWARVNDKRLLEVLQDVTTTALEAVQDDSTDKASARTTAENVGRGLVITVRTWSEEEPISDSDTHNVLSNRVLLNQVARLALLLGEPCPKGWAQDHRRKRKVALIDSEDESE